MDGYTAAEVSLSSLNSSAALVTTIVLEMGWGQESALIAFVLAGACGLVLGMLNGFIISRFKLNTMIVTLGTQTLFLGISMGLLELREITSTLPQALKNLGDSWLFEAPRGCARRCRPCSCSSSFWRRSYGLS